MLLGKSLNLMAVTRITRQASTHDRIEQMMKIIGHITFNLITLRENNVIL